MTIVLPRSVAATMSIHVPPPRRGMGLLEAILGTSGRPRRPSARALGQMLSGGAVVLCTLRTVNAVRTMDFRCSADAARSPTLSPRAPTGPVNGVVAVRVPAGRPSSLVVSRLQSVPYDATQHARHDGSGGRARTGHPTSIPPSGAGTSPYSDAVPKGAAAGHGGRDSSATSRRGPQRPVILFIYPDPTYGGAGPTSGGPRGP